MQQGWRRHGWLAVWVCAAAMLSLSGCGGGGSDGRESGRDYFPVAAGDRWLYRVWYGDDVGSLLELVRATGDVTPQRADWVLHASAAEDGFQLGALYLSVTDAAVTQLPDPAAWPDQPALPAMDLLRFPLVPGSSYVQLDHTITFNADYDDDGQNETLKIESRVSVIGFEPVQTDAGPFAEAAHVRTVITQTGIYSSGWPPVTWTTTADEWYAKGVGLVRRDIAYVSEGSPTVTRHETLVGASINGARSERVSPVATLMSPAVTEVQGPYPQIRISFSELLDASDDAPAFELRDASGARVPGKAYGYGTEWGFYPSGPLASGTYTLSFDGSATDLLGNPALPASWTFQVDAAAPDPMALPAKNASRVRSYVPRISTTASSVHPRGCATAA